MSARYDLICPRAGNDGKTYWTKIGVAFAEREGSGFVLSFEALPLPSLGRDGKLETRVLMRQPRERDDRPAKQQAGELSDDIPF